MSMLQLGAGVIQAVGLEVAATISPHQLIVQLSDARLQTDILLSELSVAFLKSLDGAILGLSLPGTLF
jgi:hypothetical protein